MPEVAERAERLSRLRRARGGAARKIVRYGTGSVVATVCSQATFLVLYGPAGASTTLSSILAWWAGAIPNYWINRSWAWGRRGRPSLRGELLPYAGIVLGTLVLAILATSGVAHLLNGTSVSHSTRTFLVSGTYFMVYVVMFAFRYVLFDRLFSTPKSPAVLPPT
ncbi:MAG TPA: GtrA family protein [Nocardioides sp.]|jgi:putative flippase GtrA|uniref:GtrA family protein n=1 Tax=Nocardioides sp. TaxID=35761 RepID=UPI002E353971|nr:GtrA family protein [Nocardioides sp.]HEX3931117.1 GtrA family protein [Nocardioides sp.]